MEAKDEDGAIPLHDACAGGEFIACLLLFILPLCSLGCLFTSAFLNHFAGYLEIAQLLLSSANDPARVNRMLETIDMEGDTVSTCLFVVYDLLVLF